MRNLFKPISVYWKYQAFGWLFYAALYTFIDIFKRDISRHLLQIYFLTALLVALLGIFLSHLMKLLIGYWGLMRLSLNKQIAFFFALTVLFTILFWTLFHIIFYTAIGAGAMLMPLFVSVVKFEHRPLGSFLAQCLTFSVPFLVWNLFYGMFHYLKKFKESEFVKFNSERQLLELEAQALRAQMNPHFIFNCLNSIKSLIQGDQKEKSVTYLTTFSKLIRTLLNNADKKEITLYDEIETCKLYLQLEAMRFDAQFSYTVEVDQAIDLKSINVPALIVQPFIENAIWHGIMPRGNGTVALVVAQHMNQVIITIEDDGIGRESSAQNKAAKSIGHQSKGVNLTLSRLELNNLLQQRKAKLEIIDKYNEIGMPAGTAVVIILEGED